MIFKRLGLSVLGLPVDPPVWFESDFLTEQKQKKKRRHTTNQIVDGFLPLHSYIESRIRQKNDASPI